MRYRDNTYINFKSFSAFFLYLELITFVFFWDSQAETLFLQGNPVIPRFTFRGFDYPGMLDRDSNLNLASTHLVFDIREF